MNIKSLLLGSAAALVAVTGARAADAVVVAEPEPVEYVKVCDAYGAGFYYIPGTETCLKIDGLVRVDVRAGDDLGDGTALDTYKGLTRGEVRFDARSETELGTLRSYIASRFDFVDGVNSAGIIPHAYIELGGFRLGVTDSRFDAWTDGAGAVIEDGLVSYAGGRTNQASYTFTGGNGFSAIVALEQGDTAHQIEDYLPHIVAGAKIEQGWGSVSAVGGYDSNQEEFAGKVRLDVKFTDTISAFVMGGYQTGGEVDDYYGAWNGDWAVWGGASFKVTEQATINGALSYEEAGKLAAVLNVNYTLVPGFVITPEIEYVTFDDDHDDAFGGIVRFQRNF
ncbi:porin [Phyllobacterium zundukense]|uniref:Porin n=1 Tax=Phyllobacterium zundukense TaxID=1867719 RepID=A0A2N9W3H1_9HYPH|nr:porin [Phyllobacterium zundukense]ATU92231.1 porin [Phyllobacterium zundukense]PIO46289.1 porin [Phyllobacterium zundukense]